MRETLARLVNVIAVVTYALLIIGFYQYVTDGYKDGVWYSLGLLVLVFAINYVFLGKLTGWNKVGK